MQTSKGHLNVASTIEFTSRIVTLVISQFFFRIFSNHAEGQGNGFVPDLYLRLCDDPESALLLQMVSVVRVAGDRTEQRSHTQE